MRTGLKLLLALGLASVNLIALGCGKTGDHYAPVAASITAEEKEAGLTPALEEKLHQENLRHPQVQFDTSVGEIVVELDAVKAPVAVANFLHYVDQAAYDNTIFHQVVGNFIALGGGFGTDLVERPSDYPIRNEAHNGLKNVRGTIAMARQAEVIDSSRSQFFFNLADNPSLDYQDRSPQGYGYCVFGKVTTGQAALDKLNSVPVEDRGAFEKIPTEQVVVRAIRRMR